MGNMPMALNVQMVLTENKLIGEKIVTPRIVNQQTLDYDTFCDYLAQGSTVTAAAEKIDVNRELMASDLATSDLTACIVIDMPKKWDTRFQQSVDFKRIVKGLVIEDNTDTGSEDTGSDVTDPDNSGSGSGTDEGGSSSGGGSSNNPDFE